MRRSVVVGLSFCLAVLALASFVPGSAAADDVTVELVVVDQDGDTISGVDVTVEWDDGSATDETLPDGSVAFGVPEGADLTVTVDHAAYVRNFPYEIEDVSVPAGESRLKEEVPVSLSATLEIDVNEDGDPVEDLRINLRDRSADRWVQATEGDDGIFSAGEGTENYRTTADGSVVIERLEQVDYRIHTSKSGYITTTTDLTLDQDPKTVNVSVETARVQVDFLVQDDYFEPAEPLENAEIRIPERGITLETFSDGGQDQRLPVNTDYDIEVSKPGYQNLTRTLEVEEDPTDFTASIQRTPQISLDLLNDQVITDQTTRVTVRNAYEEPVEGATIALNGNELGTTDATGSLDIQVESAGMGTVTATFDGLEDSATVEAFDPGDDDIPEDIEDEVAADDEDDDADDDGAGFGIVVAAVALAGVLAIGARRRF